MYRLGATSLSYVVELAIAITSRVRSLCCKDRDGECGEILQSTGRRRLSLLHEVDSRVNDRLVICD
jgi:hypothetical protein